MIPTGKLAQISLAAALHGDRYGTYEPIWGTFIVDVLSEDGIPAGSSRTLPEGCVSRVQVQLGEVTFWVPWDALQTIDGEPYDRRMPAPEEPR